MATIQTRLRELLKRVPDELPPMRQLAMLLALHVDLLAGLALNVSDRDTLRACVANDIDSLCAHICELVEPLNLDELPEVIPFKPQTGAQT